MRRSSHNSVEFPSRKRPLFSKHHSMNTTTSPPRTSSTSTTILSTNSCRFQMKQVLNIVVFLTIMSSVLFVVKYHSITTFAFVHYYAHDAASFLPHPYHYVRRRRRTTQQDYVRWKRPPLQNGHFVMEPVDYNFAHESSLNNNNTTMKHYKTRNAQDYCGAFAQEAAQNHGYMHSSSLLGQHASAVVVISGILSPMGVSLALWLHSECGVKTIVGVDSMLPNLRRVRMQQVKYLSVLQKHIPNFPRLVIPHVGIPMEEIYALHQHQPPTHIVHFVRDHHDDAMSALEHVYTMQQLLNFFLQLQQQEKKKKRVPHFVYISSTRDKDGALTTMTSAVDMLTKTFSNVHGTTATTVGLRLPLVYGDYVENSILSNKIMMMLQGDNVTTTTTTTTTQEDEQVVLFVEDAVHAIVAAMQIQPPTGLVTLDVSNSAMTMKMLQQQVEAIVSKNQNSSSAAAATTIMTTTDALTRYWLGWTPTTSIQQGASKLLSLHLAHKFPFGTVEPTLHVPTPPQRVEFPCASECARPASCALSVFDKTIKVSRPLTRGCKYAVYTVDLWGDLQDLPSSGQPSEDVSEENKWCRIAFVSSQSPLVQEVVVMQVGNHTTTNTSTVNTTLIETHSGKVQYKNWTLVFVHGNAANMSEAEYTLLKLTPKRFFSETVSRAMFVQPNRFPVPPFESLSGFFKSLDPSAKAAGRTKEYRAGVNSIFRFLPKEAKKARRVIFSSLEATFPNVPEKSPIGVYVQDLCKREGIRPNQDLLVPQVSFYTYAAHFVQNGIRRPEYEIRSTIYKGGFPFEWLKTAMIVHDLRETEARDLRCEWYDEHLFWGNTHLEDVSLAYVLGKRRIMGRVGVAPESEQGWFPIMDTDAVGQTADDVMLPDRLTNADDAELFVRILPKPKS